MERDFDHAGFVETSLMLAISKEVKMNLAQKGLITDGMSKREINKLGKMASKSFPKVTKKWDMGRSKKSYKKKRAKNISRNNRKFRKKVSNLPYWACFKVSPMKF